MRLNWTAEGLDDLARVFEFLAAENPNAAGRAVDALLNAPTRLLRQPRLGARVESMTEIEVRRLLVGHYELRYEIRGDEILVVRIFHTREDR